MSGCGCGANQNNSFQRSAAISVGVSVPSLKITDFNGDKYIQSNGEVWAFNGVAWVDTGVAIGGSAAPCSAQSGVFYVSRSFTGIGKAIIGGLTKASITSTNTTYTAQLTAASMGSSCATFPDPWSARNAALDAIAAGLISKAEIVVLSGDWTVGFDPYTFNGDAAGQLPNQATYSDIQMPYGLNFTRIPSLYQNLLYYTFTNNSTITYINAAYPLPMSYVIDNTDQPFESSIVGGRWIQLYGEASGNSSIFITIDNANAKLNFQPDYLSAQQVQVFVLSNYKKVHITMAYCDLPDTDFLFVASTREGDGTESSLYVKVDQCRFGHGVIGYPESTDFWYFISFQAQSTVRRKVISLYVGNLFLNCGASALFYVGQGGNALRQNVTTSFHIENLYHTDSNTGPGTTVGGAAGGNYALICPQGSRIAACKEFDVNIIIDNAVTQLPLFSNVDHLGETAGSINNRFKFHCSYHKKNPSAVSGRKKSNIYLYGEQLANAGAPSRYIISGVYVNTEAECVVAESDGNIYDTRTQLSGRYETTGASKPVMTFNMNADKRISLVDVIGLNDGTVPAIANAQATDSNFAGVRVATRSIVFTNVVVMYGGSSMVNITQVGASAVFVFDLNNYV